MYLSKVFIHKKELIDPYEYHKYIWNLFPDQPEKKRDFLFRVEKRVQGKGLAVLLQSAEIPVSTASAIELVDYKSYSPVLAAGQKLRFKLRANPVKTIKDGKGRKTSKGEFKKVRVPLIKEDIQKTWLEKKLNGAASLVSLLVRNDIPTYFYRRRFGNGRIQTICYEGVLVVDNEAAFMDLVVRGIGPAKAFGCGMLTLARG